MEALEEEVAESLEDAFHPQSHIFAQGSDDVQNDKAAFPKMPAFDVVTQEARAERGNAAQMTQMETGASVQAHGSTDNGNEGRPRVPSLEDFPVSIQQAISRNAQASDEASHGPRRLWQKLTQGFVQRDEDEMVVRLEPAEMATGFDASERGRTEQGRAVAGHATSSKAMPASASMQGAHTDLFQAQATTQTIGRTLSQRPQQAAVAPKIDPDLSDDELEIPPFLRRQVN